MIWKKWSRSLVVNNWKRSKDYYVLCKKEQTHTMILFIYLSFFYAGGPYDFIITPCKIY